MSETVKNISIPSSSKQELWFESMINSIKVDQLQLQTSTADEEKVKMYNNLFEGKYSEVFSEMRNKSSQFFIEELVKEYISELNNREVLN